MRRGTLPREELVKIFLPLGCPSLLSCRSNLHLMLKGCSSLLSTPTAPSSGCRSPAGSTTPYVWINRREIVHSIFVRGTSRSVRGKSNGSDLFQGLCYVKVPQLSINFFRCERTTVERLLK